MLFTQQPLIPYLSRNPFDESNMAGSAPVARMKGSNPNTYDVDTNETLHPWGYDGPFANPECEVAIVRLIGALLNWKSGSKGRDVVIISTLDIQVGGHTYVHIQTLETISFIIKCNYSDIYKRICVFIYLRTGAVICYVLPKVLSSINSTHYFTHRV